MPRTVLMLAGDRGTKPRAGGFDAVISHSMSSEVGSALVLLRAAVKHAQEKEAAWLAFTVAGERWQEDAFELAAPGLSLFDAIFGAGRVAGSKEAVTRMTRLAFEDAERLPHALLHWWVPQSHLVRTSTAAATLAQLAPHAGWLDYLFALWRGARCQKSAQPLLQLDHEPQPLPDDEHDDVLRRLETEPVFIEVPYGNDRFWLPYTGLNAGIEREQTRGLFFEADELEQVKQAVAPGARVVDVGANTGNHTVFFAGPMRARSVLPVEPLARAGAALRAAVVRNGLGNVDCSRLGVGVGEREGLARVVVSERGGLGATSLESAPDGGIRIAPLDQLVDGEVDFLKIDVEGMELEVLAGAAGLIARCRPKIFIEIANRNTMSFLAWAQRSRYRVARIFTDKGHANYLIEPD